MVTRKDVGKIVREKGVMNGHRYKLISIDPSGTCKLVEVKTGGKVYISLYDLMVVKKSEL